MPRDRRHSIELTGVAQGHGADADERPDCVAAGETTITGTLAGQSGSVEIAGAGLKPL